MKDQSDQSQVEKDFHTRTLIKEAIEDNDFLKNLSATQVEENFSRHVFEHSIQSKHRVELQCNQSPESKEKRGLILKVYSLYLDARAYRRYAREEDTKGMLCHQRG